MAPGVRLPKGVGLRAVVTRSRPASRDMRSARSASRVWPSEEVGVVLAPWWCGRCPRWPSLIATVLSSDMEVVAELGVPLRDLWG